MAIDGVLLNRIITQMNHDLPAKINRITQASNHEFVLQCFAGKKKLLYISTHPVFSRIQWTDNKPTAHLDQTHLLMLMRKHLEGGILTKIEQYGSDRVIELHIEHRDNMGVIRPYRLMVELLGKYANVIIVNDEGLIVDALKRISPFENTSRAIVGGSTYEYPPQFNKQSFESLASYQNDMPLREQFNGISPILERELYQRLPKEDPQTIVNTLKTSDTLYIYKAGFHILPLTYLNQTAQTYPIMEGLDIYYHTIQEQDRIKSHTGDLLKLIRRELKRSKQKLPKLYNDLEQAMDCEHLREAGDLLFAFATQSPKGLDTITLKNFEGSDVTIPLDPRYGGKDNARLYFKKYSKAKTSLKYLETQIQKTEHRIQYFATLLLQTEQATVEDAQEIHEELMRQGIMHQRHIRKKTQPKRAKKPNTMILHYDDTTTIYVGKNNLQNDYVSFKLAQKNDLWFHAAYDFGAHVLLRTDAVDEAKIRLCAHLAAYYSKSRYGSSVEVHYTHARNLKKIPGGQLGLVALSTHKSIYIDPDEALVLSYTKAKQS